MESIARTTGKEGACHALHEGAKTSRGKVWELPNGQFLSPVQILAEKGGTGYVSLGEIVSVYAEQGIGVIQFCGESVTLKTAMKVNGLYDCISKASRRYLEGYKDSDVVLRFIGEKEKQEMQETRKGQRKRQPCRNPFCSEASISFISARRRTSRAS